VAIALPTLTHETPSKNRSAAARSTELDKGFADGFRGNLWWPGPGIEPLSYASGYTEAQVERDTRRVERKS